MGFINQRSHNWAPSRSDSHWDALDEPG